MSEELKKEDEAMERLLGEKADTNTTEEEEKATVAEDEFALAEAAEPEKEKWLDRFTVKQKKLFVIVAVAVVAVLVAFGTYNSKGNRLRRQLDLGYRYLENEQYEEAIIAFGKAIEIDERCIEAYAGGLQGYQNLDNLEEMQAFYDRVQTAVQVLDAEALAEDMEYAVDIYVAAEDVYGDNPERAAEILEEGLDMTAQNPEVKEALVNTYIGLAETCTQEEDYEKGLTIYDRLLELDGANERVQTDLGNCLQNYFEVLKEERKYEEIRALVEKYRKALPGIDFSAILAEMDALEQREAQNRAFMEKVYSLMSAQDYDGMLEVDGSEEATAFVAAMTGERYLYFPDENESRSGTGAGVYQFGDGGYYFYYGDYADGSREGSGVSFCKKERAGYDYTVFTGNWGGDAPNGEGEIRTMDKYMDSGNQYSKVISGNFVDGLCDGYMSSQITDSNDVWDVSYTAVQGIPTEDKTEEFKFQRDFWGGDGEIPENRYIYAYDLDEITGACVWSMLGYGETIGVTGFAGLE